MEPNEERKVNHVIKLRDQFERIHSRSPSPHRKSPTTSSRVKLLNRSIDNSLLDASLEHKESDGSLRSSSFFSDSDWFSDSDSLSGSSKYFKKSNRSLGIFRNELKRSFSVETTSDKVSFFLDSLSDEEKRIERHKSPTSSPISTAAKRSVRHSTSSPLQNDITTTMTSSTPIARDIKRAPITRQHALRSHQSQSLSSSFSASSPATCYKRQLSSPVPHSLSHTTPDLRLLKVIQQHPLTRSRSLDTHLLFKSPRIGLLKELSASLDAHTLSEESDDSVFLDSSVNIPRSYSTDTGLCDINTIKVKHGLSPSLSPTFVKRVILDEKQFFIKHFHLMNNNKTVFIC